MQNTNTLDGFTLPKTQFFDSKNHPYGFSRSGIFSIRQANIISMLGRTLEALSNGSQKPISCEEESFVRYVNGKKSAQSEVERAWNKYLSSKA